MRRLAQAPNLALATLWVQMLRDDGVHASVQREYLGAAAGQLPPDQCLPEVWIEDDAQLELAERLLHAIRHRPQHRWTCRCGELVEGGFDQCWCCGAAMP
jgi:hypothetical protein